MESEAMAQAVRIDYAVPIAPRNEWHWFFICSAGSLSTSPGLWQAGGGKRALVIFGILLLAILGWAIFCSRRTTRKILIDKDLIKVKGLWNRTERTIRKSKIEKLAAVQDVRWIWFEKHGVTNCQTFARLDFSEESWNVLTLELDQIESAL